MHYANTYLERPVVGDLENVAQEGTTKVLKCMLNTGSDIYQGACKKRGSTLKEEYKNASFKRSKIQRCSSRRYHFCM